MQLMFSPSGRWLISVARSADASAFGSSLKPETVWVHDAQNANRMGHVRHDGEVEQVAITADDRLIATASLDTARVWPIGTTMEPVVLPHEQIVVGVSFAPRGSFLAVASWEEEARVWHLEDDSGPDDLPHDANVCAIAVSRDGLIATASADVAFVWRPSE